MELTIISTSEGGVNYALGKVLGKKVHTAKTPEGVPYLVDDDHYISLSHKDHHLVVAVSDRPVGIDIERLVDKESYYRIADNYFAEKVKHGDVEDFFRSWTRREAYGKMLGVGLNQRIMGMNMRSAITHDGQQVRFVEKRIDNDYMVTVSGYYDDGELVFVGGNNND